MKDNDIAKIFEQAGEYFQDKDESIYRMFAMLVKATLKYRDDLLERKDETLTVGETQKALDVFMQVLQTQEIPSDLEQNVHDLLILWLEELKQRVRH
ncbi:MAG: hypothetical protein ABH859_07850 [Pseudomonadota bacterium]